MFAIIRQLDNENQDYLFLTRKGMSPSPDKIRQFKTKETAEKTLKFLPYFWVCEIVTYEEAIEIDTHQMKQRAIDNAMGEAFNDF